MTNLQIGAQMYSVRDHTTTAEDLLEALKAVKAIGYNTCQLSGQSRDIAPEQIADFLSEVGITCSATHIGMDMIEDCFDEVVRVHKLWKCNYPGIGSMPAKYRESGSQGYLDFARDASAIAKKFRDEGLTFIYHNHAFEFERFADTGKNGMELLLENTSKAFQFELDVFWVQAGGANPIEWINKVAGRMDVAHLKEMNGSHKPPMMAPIGTGNMDWPSILAACDAIGVKYALVEQDNAVETDSIECMKVSHKNLVKYGARF